MSGVSASSELHHAHTEVDIPEVHAVVRKASQKLPKGHFISIPS